MSGVLDHEMAYRGGDAVASLAGRNLLVCGAGAVGSNLVDTLVRQGCRRLHVLDDDRVEPHNVSTQVYGGDDVGRHKADCLRDKLFLATGVEIEATSRRLVSGNAARFLKGRDLVVDAFDNSESRDLVKRTCCALGVPCLHVGLAADYGEVIWSERYRVPGDAGQDVCDYPLARNTITLAVTVAAEAILSFLLEGSRRSFTVTLRDLKILEM